MYPLKEVLPEEEEGGGGPTALQGAAVPQFCLQLVSENYSAAVGPQTGRLVDMWNPRGNRGHVLRSEMSVRQQSEMTHVRGSVLQV